MATPFDAALQIAATTIGKIAGQSIVYRAGVVTIVIPDAVLGSSEYESDEGTGAIVRAKVTDWLIMVARLSSNGQSIEPTPGHRIEHTSGGIRRTYEVQPLGSEPCYRFSGPYFDRYRIHCRQIPND